MLSSTLCTYFIFTNEFHLMQRIQNVGIIAKESNNSFSFSSRARHCAVGTLQIDIPPITFLKFYYKILKNPGYTY